MQLKKNKLFRFLGSLKLAVILLVALIIILTLATYYESLYDTKTAEHLIYKNFFFALFLFVLGINLFTSMMMRYPWKKHQAGFVTTHIGIIIILAGSLYSFFNGVDGSIAITEGDTADRVTIDQPVIYYGNPEGKLFEKEVEFRWSPPDEENFDTVRLDDRLSVIVNKYLHNSTKIEYYEPATENSEAIPAVELRLKNAHVDQSQWLTVSSGTITMGKAEIEMIRLANQDQFTSFKNNELSKLRQGNLQILVDMTPYKVGVHELRDGTRPLGDTPYSIQVTSYLPHTVVREDKLVSASEAPVNPSVELDVYRDGEKLQTWLLFSEMNEHNTLTYSKNKETLPIRFLYDHMGDRESKNRLIVASDPQGQFFYQIDQSPPQPLEVGQAIPTGWMDLELTFEQAMAKAKKVSEVIEAEVPEGTDQEQAPPPAIRVLVKQSSEPGPYWLQRGDIIKVPGSKEGEEFILGYGYKTIPLGFSIQLNSFKIGFDPGTSTPSSYESVIEINGEKQTVAMNEPGYYDKYTFYQASFSQDASNANISVFATAWDPGLPYKYFGSLLLTLGIAMMFYLKPYQIEKMKKTAKAKKNLEKA